MHGFGVIVTVLLVLPHTLGCAEGRNTWSHSLQLCSGMHTATIAVMSKL